MRTAASGLRAFPIASISCSPPDSWLPSWDFLTWKAWGARAKSHIEKNAPLSLSIADSAYVLDDGKAAYASDAADLAKERNS